MTEPEDESSCPLSRLIKRILAHKFTRAEWAGILNVTEGHLYYWECYSLLPSPLSLRKLFLAIEGFNIPGLNEEIELVKKMPSFESCKDFRTDIGKTIGHYLVQPVSDAFFSNLAAFEPAQQEAILLKAMALFDEKEGHQIPKPPARAQGMIVAAEKLEKLADNLDKCAADWP